MPLPSALSVSPHRRSIVTLLVVSLLSGLLAVAPAMLALEPSVAGAATPDDAVQICGGSGSVASASGQAYGGDKGQVYAKVWVPSGGMISTTVNGTIAPRYVSNLNEYWSEDLIRTQVFTIDMSAALTSTDDAAGSRHWPTGEPYDWSEGGANWSNVGTGRMVVVSARSLYGYTQGTSSTWSLKVVVSGGTGLLQNAGCVELEDDETDVSNASMPQSCSARADVIDPVNTVQGNFWQDWTDVAVSGRGPGLMWTRSYSSSRAATNGPLGYGWTSAMFMGLTEVSGVAKISQENGSAVRFYDNAGVWERPSRVDASLVKHGDGSWTFTRGGTEKFTFAASGKLTSIADLSGNTTTLQYTGGVLTTVTDSSGRQLQLTWTSGRVTKVAGPAAQLVTGGATVPIEVSYSYDGSGNLSTVTDPAGGVWTFTYDSSHRIVTVREPRHHALGASAPVVENHYDSAGRVDWQEDHLDRRTTLAYGTGATTVTSPAGSVVVYEHSDGICTGIVRDPGANESRWTYEVDPESLGRTKITDPNGNVTTSVFNDRGLPISINNSGRTTTIAYTAQGLPAAVTDPMNVTTTYTYDTGTDRLRTVSRPITPGSGTATTTMNYGDVANPGMVTSVVDTRGKTWTMTYTAAGDLASSTDPTAKQTTWVYNGLGWPLSTVAPAGNASGGTPSQHRTSYSYNRRGEVVATTDALGAVTEYDRDLSGNVIVQRDPVPTGTEQTGFTLNAAGELVTVTRPGGSTLTTEYNLDGQIFKQRDGATNATEYSYDAQGRLSTVKDPAARVTTYRYDAGGRVASKQQPGGNCLAVPKTGCISYTYNPTNELTGVDYSDDATSDVTFSYDNLGRRTGMNDGSASTWNMDSLGRLLSFVDSNGTVSYTFTDNGSGPTTVTYPGGKAVSRSYDDAGRQITSTGWTGGTATYGYDDNSNPTTINTGATAGVEDTHGYDRVNRMTASTLRQNTTVLTALGYSRDPEGMVTQTTSTGIAGAADTFTYGPFDQLATNSTGAYAYDSADNLTGFPDGRKQKFNAANELCYQASTNSAACGSAPTTATKYDYDGRGNRTAIRPDNRVATTLAYDQADRLKSAKVPAFPDGTGQYHDMSTANVWFAAGATWAANQVGTYQIRGANGIPAAGVDSVVLRLHVASPANFGFLTAYPAGTAPGSTVSMYYDPGDATSNLAVSTLSAAGQVSVYTTHGTLISIELVGWYGSANADGGLTFEPTQPSRAYVEAQTTGSTSAPIQITGSYGVPTTGVSAVAVVAHSLSPAAPGHLTVYSGPTAPNSVTLLYDSSAASALTIVPLDATGQIKIYTAQATTPVIDIVGYYTPVETDGGNLAHPLTPIPIADTYNHTGVCNGGTCNRLVANTTQTVKVTGVGGIPANAAAVAVVLQAIIPDATGYLTAWRTGDAQPWAASMTFDGDAYISSTAIVPVGTGGTISVMSSVGVHLIVQAVGYFDPATKTYLYTYAGDGLRKQKTAPDGTTTKFVWDRSTGIPMLLAETIDEPATASDRTVRYIYGPDGTVTSDVTTATVAGTETLRWFHHDQLGSTVAITNTTGGLLGTFAYSPVGAAGTATGSATTPIGWAGEYRDTETGFTYLRARYYDPATAQFLTRDPLEAKTRSPYAYAGNNPLNFTDPTGLAPWDGVVDVFTGGDCGDGFFDRALGGLDEFVWEHRDEIIFGLALVGMASCPMCTAAFYASMGLGAVSTVHACNSGDGAGCALGVTALVTGGAGRALSRGATPRLGVAADARLGASRWHPIQRNVTGPILRAGETAARRTGFWSGWTSTGLSGVDVVNG